MLTEKRKAHIVQHIKETCQDRVLEAIKEGFNVSSFIQNKINNDYQKSLGCRDVDIYLSVDLYLLVPKSLQKLKKDGVIVFNKQKCAWELSNE